MCVINDCYLLAWVTCDQLIRERPGHLPCLMPLVSDLLIVLVTMVTLIVLVTMVTLIVLVAMVTLIVLVAMVTLIALVALLGTTPSRPLCNLGVMLYVYPLGVGWRGIPLSGWWRSEVMACRLSLPARTPSSCACVTP